MLDNFCAVGHALGAAEIVNLVAEAPHDDGGMVAVAEDHGVEIGLPVGGEIDAVILGKFSVGPAIAGFVDDEQAEAVAGVEKGGGGGIVVQRTALKPAAFNSSTRRVSARLKAATPRGPLSSWTQAPYILRGWPLRRKPLSTEAEMVRTPKVVWRVSTILPLDEAMVTAR